MSSPAARTSGSTPLAGTVVLDLTRVLSGPYCTMLLADMGARVIKIELPGRGDDTRAWGPPFIQGESAYFLSINRNKESLTLDFKHPRGRELLDRLIARADVLVENFRPGTLERHALGYQDLAERWPRLVYCSISGFGQTGPKKDLPGYDAVVQAEGGLMSITGPPDGEPCRLGVAIGDLGAGMFAAQGITLALLARERTGRGQHVDIGMLDSVVSLLTYQAGIHFVTGAVPVRMGNRHPTIVPYETFSGADGELVVAVGNDEQWQRFCEATGLQDLATDVRFARNRDRVAHYDELRPLLVARFRMRPRADWIAALSKVGVPCGLVRSIDEVLTDAQVVARSMVTWIEHPAAGSIGMLGVPIKLSETPGGVRTAPPLLGQHTCDILSRDLGLSGDEIGALREARVI